MHIQLLARRLASIGLCLGALGCTLSLSTLDRAAAQPRVAPPVESQIIGGVKTAPEQYLEVVAVGKEAGYHCSGVLIAPRQVLTARHCLPATRVLFGAAVTAPAQVLAVERTQTPPDVEVDAALLTLDAAAPVPPTALELNRPMPPPRGMARMVGFGATDGSGHKGFGVKRSTDVPATGWGCTPLRSRILGCDPEIELVLSRYGNRDTCDGDSGGPVYFPAEPGGRLIAITSRPITGAQERCGSGGVYVRIDALTEWLRGQLAAATPLSEKK